MNTAITKMVKPIVVFTKHGLKFISKNSNLILTVVSASGAILSVVCAVKGTIKAVRLYEEVKPQGTGEIIKTVWKCYIPTIGLVLLTTIAIASNGRINARKMAVLSSALAGSQNSLKYLQEKMTEEIGPKKAQKVIDAAKSEEAKQNLPTSENDIIDSGKGKQIFFLKDYGQWIKSSYEGIQLAELQTTQDIQNSLNGIGDSKVPANVALEHLHARTCLQGEYNGWDPQDFNKGNNQGPKFRISSEWMEVLGENQIVGTVWFDPEPSPL